MTVPITERILKPHKQVIGTIVWGSTLNRTQDFVEKTDDELRDSSFRLGEGYISQAQYRLNVTEGSSSLNSFEGTRIILVMANPPVDLIESVQNRDTTITEIDKGIAIGINSFWGSDFEDRFEYVGYIISASYTQEASDTILKVELLTNRDFLFGLDNASIQVKSKKYVIGTKFDKIAEDLFLNFVDIDPDTKQYLSQYELKKPFIFRKNLAAAQEDFIALVNKEQVSVDQVSADASAWIVAMNSMLSSLSVTEAQLKGGRSLILGKSGVFVYKLLFYIFYENIQRIKTEIDNFSNVDTEKKNNFIMRKSDKLQVQGRNYLRTLNNYNEYKNTGSGAIGLAIDINASSGALDRIQEYLAAPLARPTNNMRSVVTYINDPSTPILNIPPIPRLQDKNSNPTSLYFIPNFSDGTARFTLTHRSKYIENTQTVTIDDKDLIGNGVYFTDGYIKCRVRPYNYYLQSRFINIKTIHSERNSFVNPLTDHTLYEIFYYNLVWDTMNDTSFIELSMSNYDILFKSSILKQE